MNSYPPALKSRQRLGKFRIARRLGEGAFAVVYKAYDTIEGIYVALKLPRPYLMTEETIQDFRNEVRLIAALDHPNILQLKNASFIDDYFVIVQPLGECSLADRLKRRLSVKTGLDLSEQLLQALAHAHKKRLIHCDVKPENIILFPGNQLRLCDFGIARVALHTLSASGSGTVGYVAPEQAMGKPSSRSDVFSAALVLYRMFAGELPEWPFRWPMPGVAKLRRKLHPEMVEFLRRAIQVDAQKRFDNAFTMLRAYRRLKPRMKALLARQARRRRGNSR